MVYDEAVQTPQGECDTEFGKMKWTIWENCARFSNADTLCFVNRVAARIEVHFKFGEVGQPGLSSNGWKSDIVILRRQDRFEDLSWTARDKVVKVLLAKINELATHTVMAQAVYKAKCDAVATAEANLTKALEAVDEARLAADAASKAKQQAERALRRCFPTSPR